MLLSAIWYIENEGGNLNNDGFKYLYDLAYDAVYTHNYNTWSGLGPVRVMNIVWGEQYTNSGTTL